MHHNSSTKPPVLGNPSMNRHSSTQGGLASGFGAATLYALNNPDQALKSNFNTPLTTRGYLPLVPGGHGPSPNIDEHRIHLNINGLP